MQHILLTGGDLTQSQVESGPWRKVDIAPTVVYQHQFYESQPKGEVFDIKLVSNSLKNDYL